MDKILGLEYADFGQRKQFLADNCDRIEEVEYMKQFTPEQLIDMKERLAQVSIKINDIENEKKAAMDLFKDRLKPYQEEKHMLLDGIKQGAEYVTENGFVFTDSIEMMVGVYNEEGLLVSHRPASEKELQATIFQISRAGSDD